MAIADPGSAIGDRRSAIAKKAADAAALALSGCASLPAGTADAATPSAASVGSATGTASAQRPAAAGASSGSPPAAGSGAAPGGSAAAGQPRPFAEVIKEAKETPGLIGLWQKDEKVWLEIAPEQFGVPYLFTANLSRGVGEKGIYGGMMLLDQIVEFRRIGNTVQLIAKNFAFTGGTSGPMAQGVKEGLTDSLLGAATVVSQPHPDRKTVLVDANALLLTDIPVGLLLHQQAPLAQSRMWSSAARGTPLFESLVDLENQGPEQCPWPDLPGAALVGVRSWPYRSFPLHLQHQRGRPASVEPVLRAPAIRCCSGAEFAAADCGGPGSGVGMARGSPGPLVPRDAGVEVGAAGPLRASRHGRAPAAHRLLRLVGGTLARRSCAEAARADPDLR